MSDRVSDRVEDVEISHRLAARDSFGPPRPVPEWLRPLRGPIGEDDLRIAPSTEELRTIVRLLDYENLAGYAMITQRDGSPWLEVAVAVPLGDARTGLAPQTEGGLAPHGTYRYAIWRYTCLPYRVGEDGAVEDDPLWGGVPDGA